MALALELSRRDEQAHHTPQKTQIQNRFAPEFDRSRSSPYSSTTHRSFSSAPCYHYEGSMRVSDADEDDEDLQMALACSLSEMEAKQRANAADYISGARGRGGAMSGKTGGQRGGRVVETARLNVSGSEAEEKDLEGHFKMGKGQREAGFPPESYTAANTTPPNHYSEEEPEPAIKTSNGSLKKKKKCGCIVC